MSFETTMASWMALPAFWAIMGITLACLEMILPGVYLLWLGAGSFVVAGTIMFFPLSLQSTMILFTIASVSFMVMGASAYRRTLSKKQGDASLNRRGSSLIGQELTLDEPIENGKGRVRIGDSHWSITGPDLPMGTIVIVKKVDGNHLIVKASDR